jgi:hypothetical protein
MDLKATAMSVLTLMSALMAAMPVLLLPPAGTQKDLTTVFACTVMRGLDWNALILMSAQTEPADVQRMHTALTTKVTPTIALAYAVLKGTATFAQTLMSARLE